MNKLAIAKMAVSAIVGAGTTKIVTAIVKNNIQPDKLIDKVTVVSGAFVLGSMAADASKKYTDAKIDEAVNWFNETFPRTTD
jgi:large-conductance mechanosensitive channel